MYEVAVSFELVKGVFQNIGSYNPNLDVIRRQDASDVEVHNFHIMKGMGDRRGHTRKTVIVLISYC